VDITEKEEEFSLIKGICLFVFEAAKINLKFTFPEIGCLANCF
jgi:hypothetical protein